MLFNIFIGEGNTIVNATMGFSTPMPLPQRFLSHAITEKIFDLALLNLVWGFDMGRTQSLLFGGLGFQQIGPLKAC